MVATVASDARRTSRARRTRGALQCDLATVLLITKKAKNNQIATFLAVPDGVTVVVEETVGLLVDEAGKQLHSVADLSQGQVGKGKHLELQLLEKVIIKTLIFM